MSERLDELYQPSEQRLRLGDKHAKALIGFCRRNPSRRTAGLITLRASRVNAAKRRNRMPSKPRQNRLIKLDNRLREFVNTTGLSLEEWLDLVNNSGDEAFINYAFPTNRHLKDYLASIDSRSQDDVLRLVFNFLIPSTSLRCDADYLTAMELDQDERPEVYEYRMSKQYYRRLFCYENHLSKSPPWEGITWILDLLPDHPRKALEALKAYISAHAQMLPDGRFQGLLDAAEIIRAKFIGTPRSNSEKVHLLRNLDWRDFEYLVAALYRAMRYETQVTPPIKDGGRDIIATKRSPGRLAHLRIECKLYDQEPVGLGFVQRLLGVVSGEKVNKGVLVTSSRFTKPALKYAKENPRLELINGEQLVLLMNEYLGSTWPLQIERFIAEGQDNQRKKVRHS